jgi:prophage regulatory protein
MLHWSPVYREEVCVQKNRQSTKPGRASSLERLIPWKELREIIPYSRTHIARLEKRHEFPRRIRLGYRRVGWREDLVLDWLEQKMKQT